MKVKKYFPYDYETLLIIKEIEVLLGFKHKECIKMSYFELIEYIDQLAKMSLRMKK